MTAVVQKDNIGLQQKKGAEIAPLGINNSCH
jgi:hypothetical protein